MKRRVVLFVFVLSIMFLVASCASNKTKEVEVVEIAEEPVIEPIKAEIIDDYLYINNHKVEVYLNGGTIKEDVDVLLSEANDNGYVSMPSVEKDGYIFLGWYDIDADSFDNRKQIKLSSIERDMKLEAVFKLDVNAIAFSMDSGDSILSIKASHPQFDITVSAPMYSISPVSIADVMEKAEKDRVMVIPEISMENYIFLGWKEEGKEELSKSVEIRIDEEKGSKSYEALFLPDLSKAKLETGVEGNNAWFKGSLIGLSIKVNAPFDSYFKGDVESIISGAIASYHLPLPTLERKGYDFIGWRRVGEDTVSKDLSIDILSMKESLEYEAVFEKIVYTITYDEIGVLYEEKEVVPVVEVVPLKETEIVEEEVITNPGTYTIEDSFTFTNPMRTGYTFMGWILDGEEPWEARFTEEIKEGTIGDRKYHAVWSPNTYTITLNLNGGVVEDAPSSFVFDEESFVLPIPEKEDYVFLGWKSGNDEPLIDYTVDTTSPESITLDAIWTPVVYTIDYNENIVLYSPKLEPLPEPEVVPENPKSYTVLDSFTLINPTLEGYTFKGWIEDGEESYEAKADYSLSVGSSGDRVISAVWIPNVYTLSYDLSGGSITSEEPLTFTFNSDSPVFIEPELENYVFQGWVYDENNEPFKTLDTTVPGDKELKAVFKPYDFSIDYDLDGGEFIGEYVDKYSVESPTFTTTKPVKNGYEFVGWTNKDSERSTLFSLSLVKDDVRTNLNAYSDHMEIYTSLFDKKTKALLSSLMNEAGVTGVVENGVLNIAYSDLETEEILGLVTSILDGTGIVIDGTYFGSKEMVPYVTVVNGSVGDIALKAVWKVITYTIDYDEDGVIFGSDLNRKAENACWYTVESAFQVINPEKKGYDFVGWILEGEATSKARSIYEFSKGTTGDKNLVAVWKPCQYSINLDTKGGKIDEYPSSYSYLDGDHVIPTPEKANYEFLGWRVEGEKDGDLYKKYTIYSGNMGDVSLVAQWKAKEYSIEYELDGGKLSKGVENPSEYTVLDRDIILSNPTRLGYTFLGWTENPYSTSRTYSLRYTIFTNRGTDLKLTATWAPIEYSISYDLDGGYYRYDNTNPTKYTIETDGIYLATPVKDGYTFLGWIMGGDKTEALRKGLVLPAGSTGNVKFYAIWEKNTVPVGEVTKEQINQLVYGKDGILRPDWMVKLPEEAGYHYEKAYSDNPDLFDAIIEAQEMGERLISQWVGTTFTRSDRSVDGSTYLTSGVDFSNTIKHVERVEYWQDGEGRTWVLLRVSENNKDIE